MSNSKLWVTVANRTGMRVFKYEIHKDELSLVHQMDHPVGHLKDSELGTGQPGRAFDSIGMARHGVSSHQSPSEHVSETFAKKIAKFLEDGRMKHEYSQLILVAEPGFLGLLRQNLSTSAMHSVVHTINKDFAHMSEHDLGLYFAKNLKEYLQPS